KLAQGHLGVAAAKANPVGCVSRLRLAYLDPLGGHLVQHEREVFGPDRDPRSVAVPVAEPVAQHIRRNRQINSRAVNNRARVHAPASDTALGSLGFAARERPLIGDAELGHLRRSGNPPYTLRPPHELVDLPAVSARTTALIYTTARQLVAVFVDFRLDVDNASDRAVQGVHFVTDTQIPVLHPSLRGHHRSGVSDRTLAQPTDAVAVQPLAVFVDGVPPEQELDLVVGELEALPGPLTARLPEVLRCGPHHFPAERQFRQPIGEGDQPVSWRYRSALLLG